MSRQYSETTEPSVGAPACAYATLAKYNQGSVGMKPQVTPGTVSGHYIVPSYSAPGYNTLTHGRTAPSCSGFFNITNAYKGAEGACNQKFVRKLCG